MRVNTRYITPPEVHPKNLFNPPSPVGRKARCRKARTGVCTYSGRTARAGRGQLVVLCRPTDVRCVLSPSVCWALAVWLWRVLQVAVQSGCDACCRWLCSLAVTRAAGGCAVWLWRVLQVAVQSGCDACCRWLCSLAVTRAAGGCAVWLWRVLQVAVQSGCDACSRWLCSLAVTRAAGGCAVWLWRVQQVAVQSSLGCCCSMAAYWHQKHVTSECGLEQHCCFFCFLCGWLSSDVTLTCKGQPRHCPQWRHLHTYKLEFLGR